MYFVFWHFELKYFALKILKYFRQILLLMHNIGKDDTWQILIYHHHRLFLNDHPFHVKQELDVGPMY